MKEYLTIKELPVSERPYEKLERYGAESLSDAELLAVIIRSGTKTKRAIDVASEVLNLSRTYDGLIGINHLSIDELTKIEGIGKVKAIQILSVVELTRRMAKTTSISQIYFDSPDKIAMNYMQDLRHLETEQIILLLLNSKNKLLKELKLSQGTVNASLATPREVFIYALKHGAVNIILLHNHPSGDPTPSREDILLTNRICETGKMIGINLLDHIVIGDNIYTSMAEKKLF